MATLRYNPRPSLRPNQALTAVLADMLRDPRPAPAPAAPAFVPAADLLETAAGFELHLALPGVRKEAIRIELLDGRLVVSGTRPHPAAPAAAAPAEAPAAGAAPATPAAPRVHRLETGYGAFRRSFRLPETVNAKAIGAALADGVLRLTLPLDPALGAPQHIEIR